MDSTRMHFGRLVLAALACACLEIGAVELRAGDLFLSTGEHLRFIGSATVLWLFAVSVAALIQDQVRRLPEQHTAAVFGTLALFFSAAVTYGSTGGRRVIEMRMVLTAVFAALGGGAAYVATKRGLGKRLMRTRLATGPRKTSGGLLRTFLSFVPAPIPVLGAAALIAVDLFVLPRLYPAFHWGVSLLAAWSAGFAVQRDSRAGGPEESGHNTGAQHASPALSARPAKGRFFPQLLFVSCVVFGLAAAVLLSSLAAKTNARYVVEQYGALTQKPLSILSYEHAEGGGGEPASDDEQEGQRGNGAPGLTDFAGPDLVGQSVLLITVDALRYDRLARMPFLNRFAEENVSFTRAYTPTPHTSYALGSLLTGKPLRPVLQITTGTDHASLPGILREYGYRTASFYPPAIFFVDTERFGDLADRGFDFEYRRTMFAPAAARVGQLRRYLEMQEPDRLVFAWVHLFEPHEPYDPPERFQAGTSAEARYDGEVAATDEALEALVRVFRERSESSTIIITADHGEEFGDHGGYYHGSTLYDEQVRVPLIWSSPGLAPQRINAPVELHDVTTTLLSGLGIPANARMRGDDLGGLLVSIDEGAEEVPDAATIAFAEVHNERMAVGRFGERTMKLICNEGRACRLYDLARDPRERENLAAREPEIVTTLRRAQREFAASIPRIEAAALPSGSDDESGYPEALAAAELGEGTASELIPLLASERATVRESAARHLGRLGSQRSRNTLLRLSENDDEAGVRLEASLALVQLGDLRALDRVRHAVADDPESPWSRRAALSVNHVWLFVPSLLAILKDDGEPLERRLAAVHALGQVAEAGVDVEERNMHRGARTLSASTKNEVVSALLLAMEEINLRPSIARVLGGFSGAQAPRIRRALLTQLAQERYVGARGAEASALSRLGERRVVPLIRRWLGVPEPLPGGVALLLEMNEATEPDRTCGDREAIEVEVGGVGARCESETCDEASQVSATVAVCPGGSLELPAGETPRRLVARVGGRGEIRLGGATYELQGTHELSVHLPPGPATSISLPEHAALLAYVIVPVTEDIPPPPPEVTDPEAANE